MCAFNVALDKLKGCKLGGEAAKRSKTQSCVSHVGTNNNHV